MNLDELYKLKGRLQTEIEIAQAHLQQVNKQIINIINQPKQKEEKKKEKKEEAIVL